MEFNEKLRELRKQKGLTQEELAQALYVSRTAISKWESGRGYPNIDSLKGIAKIFSVSIDELLSGEELLTVAEEDNRQRGKHFLDMVFGLMDCSAAMLFFLPLFRQNADGGVQSVLLLSLTEPALYLGVAFWAVIVGTIVSGILTLALQNCQHPIWLRSKAKLSLLFNIAGALLFIVSLQPYAAVFFFVFLLIKVIMLVKLP